MTNSWHVAIRRSLAIGLVLLVVVTASPPAGTLASAPSVEPDETGVCIAWNIAGEWQYRASGGGYGTLNFLQNVSGNLTGTWHNVAAGSNGNLTGRISGASVVWGDAVSGANLQATINPAGTKMAGTYTEASSSGTWEATGAARCTQRQTPLPSGSVRAVVKWGEYTYYVLLEPSSATSESAMPKDEPSSETDSGLTLEPDQANRPPRITYLGDVTLDIDVVIYDQNPPGSLQVVRRVDGGPRQNIGAVTRVGPSSDGGTLYRGRVTNGPSKPIGVGGREQRDVYVVDPQNNERLVTTIDAYLIDPSGYIYDTSNNARIQSATVSCFKKEGGSWVLWNATQFLQTNPQVSDTQGRYGWEVPEGDYQVRVSRSCYRDAQSSEVHIPPPRTDVNIGLTPASCSNLQMTDIWTADTQGITGVTFRTGQQIEHHLVVASTATGDVQTSISWAVTDPQGKRVEALSGSGNYTVASFGAEVRIRNTIPPGSAEGTYTFIASLTSQQQTSFKATQFQVVPGAMVSYLPLVYRRFGQQQQAGIGGRVKYNGAAAAGIPLNLRRCDSSSCTTAASTTTGSDGGYLFENVATLGSGLLYYVRYGPNSTDSHYVSWWYGPDITSYTAGAYVPGGDFDIANVTLVSPPDGATVRLPVTFSWQQRGLAGDTYRYVLFDPDSDAWWRTSDLGSTGSFTLTGLPSGATYGKTYGWYVQVFNGPDSFGVSYYYQEVILAAGTSAEAGAPLEMLYGAGDQPAGERGLATPNVEP
jgi:hypothetical protein